MSTLEILREKGAEAIGKVGLAGVVTTEAGKVAGILDNVSAVQVVSGAGITIMIIERSFNLYWNAKEKGNPRVMLSLLCTFWIVLSALVYLVAT